MNIDEIKALIERLPKLFEEKITLEAKYDDGDNWTRPDWNMLLEINDQIASIAPVLLGMVQAGTHELWHGLPGDCKLKDEITNYIMGQALARDDVKEWKGEKE